jgi:hypothetical protein
MKEKLLNLLDYAALASAVGGAIWAAVSYVLETWDVPAMLVTSGMKVAALWKPLTLLGISSLYMALRK